MKAHRQARGHREGGRSCATDQARPGPETWRTISTDAHRLRIVLQGGSRRGETRTLLDHGVDSRGVPEPLCSLQGRGSIHPEVDASWTRVTAGSFARPATGSFRISSSAIRSTASGLSWPRPGWRSSIGLAASGLGRFRSPPTFGYNQSMKIAASFIAKFARICMPSRVPRRACARRLRRSIHPWHMRPPVMKRGGRREAQPRPLPDPGGRPSGAGGAAGPRVSVPRLRAARLRRRRVPRRGSAAGGCTACGPIAGTVAWAGCRIREGGGGVRRVPAREGGPSLGRGLRPGARPGRPEGLLPERGPVRVHPRPGGGSDAECQAPAGRAADSMSGL